MTSRPKFYLPVILPPLKDPSDPAAYYAAIEAQGAQVTADSPSGDGSLEITITNPTQLHPGQFTDPLPVSTVFAPTAGFVRYYSGSAVLPTPGQQPAVPPPALTAADFGSVRTRVWVSDYAAFVKKPSADESLANQHVLIWLDPTTVEAAFAAEVTKVKEKVLKKSWEDGGGTGTVPNRQGLEAAFLQRLMAGGAEIFVDAGTPLGSAVTTPSGDARLKLQTFFVPPDPLNPTLPTAADDLIDAASATTLYDAHPVRQSANSSVGITFESTFMIWDNDQRTYIPFANKNVKLMKKVSSSDNGVEINQTTTGADGSIANLQATLLKGDLIYFQYATQYEHYGTRDFEVDIKTETHAARTYLQNNVNQHVYKAYYSFYDNYSAFIDELSDLADEEQFNEDRGNALIGDNSKESKHAFLPGDNQHEFLETIKDSEALYKSDPQPAKMYTVLFEGDSWMNYPLARADIYGHLRAKLEKSLEDHGCKLIVFPLQHYGDRSDQMFAGSGNRQWKYTADLLSEFKVDLIVCSSGGNDIAEPGIGNATEYEQARKFFTDGYFDPQKAEDDVNNELVQSEKDIFLRQVKKSFAVLLKNHRWSLYLDGQPPSAQWSEAALTAHLDAKLNDLAVELGQDPNSWLGGSGAIRQEIGKRVIQLIPGKVTTDSVTGAQTPGKVTLPGSVGDAHDLLLTAVLDATRYKDVFDSVKSNWQIILAEAKKSGIPVISHTYCYPFFNEYATSPGGGGQLKVTGPWFKPRFEEANIANRRVRDICLKSVLDNYVGYVLEPLKGFYNQFYYVDVRAENSEDARWRDEMHLRAEGFAVIAEKIYAVIQTLQKYQEVTQ